MGLPGVDRQGPRARLRHPMQRGAFGTNWTQPEGVGAAIVHEARVVDINMANWTVDCVTVFDHKSFFDIQVASPYMHSNSGEGIYVMPEVGAKCYVCIPSDGPPPFVLLFIMPAEAVTDVEEDEEGTRPIDSTYAGGRPRAKPGDIVMRGRDGNFVILHRGGVLQFGSSELAQRICVPIGNLITDISQNYNHFNTAGSINWGVRTGSPEDDPETEYRQTFRVLANDEFADIRVAVGTVHQPVPEKPGDASSSSDLEQLLINKQVVWEMVLAPGGFETDTGTPNTNARDAVKLKMFFDVEGNAMLRVEGSVSVRVKKKLRIRVDDAVEVFTKKNLTLESEGLVRIAGGKSLELATNDGVVKINGGTKPVAHVGSQILITTLAPIPITTSVGPGTINVGAIFAGSVSTGNPTILV